VFASSLPDNGCISWLFPRSEVRTPLVVFRQVCRNYRKVIVFRSAYHVDCPPRIARA
jgi:hypothetical protein